MTVPWFSASGQRLLYFINGSLAGAVGPPWFSELSQSDTTQIVRLLASFSSSQVGRDSAWVMILSPGQELLGLVLHWESQPMQCSIARYYLPCPTHFWRLAHKGECTKSHFKTIYDCNNYLWALISSSGSVVLVPLQKWFYVAAKSYNTIWRSRHGILRNITAATKHSCGRF